ncbi:MAG TPA: hypothetical protein VLK33_04670 [Terriglobales bacterium]|nr:hypothetical protein [Terriglobales bacterium]
MKLVTVLLIAVVICAGLGWAAYQNTLSPEKSLSPYVPAGPLLCLEAKDFGALLKDWSSSAQKRQWIASDNYEVFSRSRLFLRLKGAGDQFATAAGLPASMDFLSQVGGTHSVLALYDIGNLQFLYITHLPSAKSMESALWQTRSKFEPRNAGGVDFYVRRDPESQKEVAFAVSGEYLVLATREDLIAGALQLMSGNKANTMESEAWWAQSVKAAGSNGDLRMVLNMEKIVPSPYFRTYWVQQNITDLKQYSAAVSDLFRSSKQYREERVLIRKNESEAPLGAAEAADLVRFVPAGAGIYKAKASPSSDVCLELIQSKLLTPHLGPAPISKIAPDVQLGSGETGSGSDLETRIDQTEVQHPTVHTDSALKQLLDKTQITASLQVQSTDLDKAGVFVRIRSAIVLAAGGNWDEAAVKSAFIDLVRPSLTASQLGVGWQQKSGYQQLDGLWPLVVSVHGKYVLVADDSSMMEAMLANLNRKSEMTPAILLAGFNHQHERDDFARFSTLVDRPNRFQGNYPGSERQPQFFSENIGSLSSTFAGVSAENVIVRAETSKVTQTVTYEWTQ